MRLAALVLGLLVVGAGCFGSDDDGDDTGGAGADPIEPAETDTAVEQEANATTWSYETHEGGITSVNVVVGTLNVEGEGLVWFDVAEGTTEFVLNLTADGGELNMMVGDPDCEPESTATCETTATTEGGTATYSVEGPAPGSWHARFFGAEPGPTQASYVLEVAQGS